MKTRLLWGKGSWTLILAWLAAAGVCQGDTIGGINFGSAGPDQWGILELGGAGAAGFGTSGQQVSINGPNAGVYGTATQANIGIADGGHANFSGTTLIQGMLDEASTHGSNSISGTTIAGGMNLNYNFSTAATDAANGLAAALSLSCNMGALCNTALNPGSSMTINPLNPGGQNVLILSSITLNSAYVTLGDGGSANTTWVLIDKGNFSTSGGAGAYPNGEGILLGSLLTPWSDLIVVKGNLSTSGGGNNAGGGSTLIDGVLVVPTGTAQFAPGHVNGEVIGGGSMSFASGAQVEVPAANEVPEPNTVTFLAPGLALCALARRRRFV